MHSQVLIGEWTRFDEVHGGAYIDIMKQPIINPTDDERLENKLGEKEVMTTYRIAFLFGTLVKKPTSATIVITANSRGTESHLRNT